MGTKFIVDDHPTAMTMNKLIPVIALDPLTHTSENQYRCLEASCPCHRSFERALIPAEAPHVVPDQKLQARMPDGYTLATLEHRNKTVYIMLLT